MLPKYLDGKRLILCNAQPYTFALSIKGIKVNVRDNTKWAGSRRKRKLGKMFVGEFRLLKMAGGG